MADKKSLDVVKANDRNKSSKLDDLKKKKGAKLGKVLEQRKSKYSGSCSG